MFERVDELPPIRHGALPGADAIQHNGNVAKEALGSAQNAKRKVDFGADDLIRSGFVECSVPAHLDGIRAVLVPIEGMGTMRFVEDTNRHLYGFIVSSSKDWEKAALRAALIAAVKERLKSADPIKGVIVQTRDAATGLDGA